MGMAALFILVSTLVSTVVAIFAYDGSSFGLWEIEGSQIPAPVLVQERNYRILLKAAKKLQQRYQQGDREDLIAKGILKCRDVPGGPLVHRDYLKCNPHYLNCFLKSNVPNLQNKFLVKFEGQEYWVQANPLKQEKYYRIISRGKFSIKKIPHYSVLLNISLQGKKVNRGLSLDILLEDTCRDVYLPLRIYVYREHSRREGGEHIWNNFNRDIYIDKRQVTFRDIVDWLDSGAEEKISIPLEPAQWALPASNLTTPQMERYCQFLGKQVATALVYDAASFFPINIKQPTYIDRQFPPFPWSKRALGHPLLAVQQGRMPFAPTICSDILAQECVGLKQVETLQNLPGQRTSWVGVKDLLGGHPEYLRNSINPQYNLRVSSFYLKGEDHWHRLGHRGTWSGKGFEVREFTLRDKPLFSQESGTIKVGFRCMLDGPGEA